MGICSSAPPAAPRCCLHAAPLDIVPWACLESGECPRRDPSAREVSYWGDPATEFDVSTVADVAAGVADALFAGRHALPSPPTLCTHLVTPRPSLVFGSHLSPRDRAAVPSQCRGPPARDGHLLGCQPGRRARGLQVGLHNAPHSDGWLADPLRLYEHARPCRWDNPITHAGRLVRRGGLDRLEEAITAASPGVEQIRLQVPSLRHQPAAAAAAVFHSLQIAACPRGEFPPRLRMQLSVSRSPPSAHCLHSAVAAPALSANGRCSPARSPPSTPARPGSPPSSGRSRASVAVARCRGSPRTWRPRAWSRSEGTHDDDHRDDHDDLAQERTQRVRLWSGALGGFETDGAFSPSQAGSRLTAASQLPVQVDLKVPDAEGGDASLRGQELAALGWEAGWLETGRRSALAQQPCRSRSAPP